MWDRKIHLDDHPLASQGMWCDERSWGIIRIYHKCEGRIEIIRPEDRRLASLGLPSDLFVCLFGA